MIVHKMFFSKLRISVNSHSVLSFLLTLIIFFCLSGCNKDDEVVSIFQPEILDVIPSEGPINTEIMIIGRKFAVDPVLNIVRCGTSNLEVVRVSADTIWAKIPRGTTTAKITVRVKDIKDTPPSESPFEFTVLGPEILTIVPLEAIAGDTIQINGKYISPNSVDFSLTLNKKDLGQIITKSDTGLTVILAKRLQTGYIKLTSSDQEVNSPEEFFMLPSISSIKPTTVPEAMDIDIEGTNFLPEPSVLIANKEATIILANDSILRVSVPSILSAGELKKEVTIQVSVQGHTSAERIITVLPTTAPAIYSISPELASPGEEIIVKGRNFGNDKNAIRLEFSGLLGQKVIADILTISETELSAKVPTGTSTGAIYLSRDNIEAEGGPLTLPVTITELKPSNIWEGSEIQIGGSNFPANNKDIGVEFQLNDKFGGGLITVNPTAVNSTLTEITLKVPKGTKNNSTFSINVNQFVFKNDELPITILKPTISSIFPNVAPISSLVIIKGSAFSSVAENNRVFFPGPANTRIKAVISNAKYSEIQAIVPMGVTEGNIVVGVLDGQEIEGPFFKFGKQPPVFYFSSNSSTTSGGVYRAKIVPGPNGSETIIDQILAKPGILDIKINKSSKKIFAISNTQTWVAGIDTDPVSWQELYTTTPAINFLKRFALNEEQLFLVSNRNFIQTGNETGTLFNISQNGNGTPRLIYDNSNGLNYTRSDSHIPSIDFSDAGGLFWALKESDLSVLGVNQPYNIVKGDLSGNDVTVVYSADQLLRVSGFSSGTLNATGSSLVTDLDISENNDLFVCHGIPIDLGSNVAVYSKIFRGDITGATSLVQISSPFINDKDKINTITLGEDYIYGIYSTYIFRMKSDGSDFEKIISFPAESNLNGDSQVMRIEIHE